MPDQQMSIDDYARSYARTASDGFADTARYLRGLADEDWDGPSGCSEWSVRDLAGHVVGEAVWFPNLARGVTKGEQPLPMDLYEAMKSYPRDRLTHTLEEAAHELWSAIDEATTEQLQQPVDLGFTRMPLGRATLVSACEAVFHNWDARVGRDPAATIPMEWAAQIANGVVEYAPLIANREGASEAAGTYLLQVGDGVGPITLTAGDGNVRLQRGMEGTPDVTLHLTADQYDRLIAGRLDLNAALERGEVTVEGDRSQALGLTRIFQGI